MSESKAPRKLQVLTLADCSFGSRKMKDFVVENTLFKPINSEGNRNGLLSTTLPDGSVHYLKYTLNQRGEQTAVVLGELGETGPSATVKEHLLKTASYYYAASPTEIKNNIINAAILEASEKGYVLLLPKDQKYTYDAVLDTMIAEKKGITMVQIETKDMGSVYKITLHKVNGMTVDSQHTPG